MQRTLKEGSPYRVSGPAGGYAPRHTDDEIPVRHPYVQAYDRLNHRYFLGGQEAGEDRDE
jgi:hypothetical protein